MPLPQSLACDIMRKWLKHRWRGVAMAAALCATIAVAASSRPRGDSVTLQFLHDTNLADRAFLHACFLISNRASTTVKVHLEREVQNYERAWSSMWFWRWGSPGSDEFELEPLQSRLYHVRYPEGDQACRALLAYYQPLTNWEKRRWSWADWLFKHKLTTAAKWLQPRPENRVMRSEEKRNSPKKGQGAD